MKSVLETLFTLFVGKTRTQVLIIELLYKIPLKNHIHIYFTISIF